MSIVFLQTQHVPKIWVRRMAVNIILCLRKSLHTWWLITSNLIFYVLNTLKISIDDLVL